MKKIEQIRLRLNIPLLDRLRLSDTTTLLVTAILVGGGTGLGAVGFIKLIALVQGLFFGGGVQIFGFLGRGIFILIPTIGGLLAGPIISFFAKEAKGHGVPEVMQAIALQGGRIRPRVVVAKIAASALCIGSGGSAGREGPIVQVGAALGSTLGQWLKLSSDRIRNLVACGAAAGIAATFNAPIAGVVFAMEVILGELHLGDLGNVVVSAVTASTISRIFLGQRPAFSIPDYSMRTPWEVILYAFLGVTAALIATSFIRLLYWFEDKFDTWRFPDALKPAVGGVLLGCMAVLYPMVLGLGFVPSEENLLGLPLANSIPHVFGAGFPVIEGALLGQLSFWLLFALMFLKPLATSLTLGSGNSGGVFAPSLFTGAALGGAFGYLVEHVFPGMTAGVGAFATVGMAAVFAGAARAPFTAILIVFEMTDDIQLILPLMAAVIFSMIVSERLLKDSIYTLKLTRRGIRLRRGRDVDVMENITVKEVMRPSPKPVSCTLPLRAVPHLLDAARMHGLPVVDIEGRLQGVVTIQDVESAVESDKENLEQPVLQFCSQQLVVAYPDETLQRALERMSHRDIGRLPVVDHNNPTKLVGWISRADIIRAYERALTRRVTAQQHMMEARLGVTVGVDIVECEVEEGSPVSGQALSNVSWPDDSLVASVQRGGGLIIPHGKTEIQVGDRLVVVARRGDEEAVRALMRKNNRNDNDKEETAP